ncbi:MAG: DNA repair exonuclease [Ignavibacteria bacterium]
MGLRFIHFSDTHLGFSDLDELDEKGKNVREEDIYKAFSVIVDEIVERKPDFVIHSGDIFHRSSPSNRALVKASELIQRISDAGIPFYIIAGNHDFPKAVSTTPIHDLYKGRTRIFSSEAYEIIETEDYIIHALPHINSDEKFRQEASKIEVRTKSKPNILVMHLSMPNYLMNEFGERVFPEEYREKIKDFDYVALGHWHSYHNLTKYGNVFYSGSTEMISDKDSSKPKGFIEVTIDGKLTADFIPIKTRLYKTIVIKDCYTKEKGKIIEEIKAESAGIETVGAVIYLQLIDLTQAQFYEFSQTECGELFGGSLYFCLIRKIKGNDESYESDSATFDLKGMLEDELKKNFSADAKGVEIVEIAMKLLSEIEEEEVRSAD